MKKLLLPILFFPLILQAQWESIGTEILPQFHRVWSIKMAPDYSVWVFSTYDAFPTPAGEVPVVHRLADGSTEWKSTPMPNSEMALGVDIEPLDSMTAYAAVFSSGLFKTTDGSATWQEIDSYPFNPIFVHFFDENQGWVGGADTTANAFFVSSFTTDGGASWSHTGSDSIGQAPGTSIPELDSTELTGIAYSANSSYDVVGDTIMMGRSSGTYWLSTDRGKNWERISTPLVDMELRCTNIAMKNTQEFLIGSDFPFNPNLPQPEPIVMVTRDGGQTWNEAFPGVTTAASHYIPNTDGTFVTSGHQTFGAGGQGTVITYDFGETWEIIDGTRIIAMDFVDHEHGVATCCNIWSDTQGQIYKWNLEVPTPTDENVFSQNIEMSPNPTSGYFNFYFPKNISAEKINLEIVSNNGSILKKSSLPYSDKIEMDISDFPSGFYFLKAWVGNQFFTKKIIKK